MSKRTKVIFGLTTLPIVSTGITAVWALYPHFGAQNDATYFVVYHVNWGRMILTSAVVFACGLISLSFDRLSAGRK